MRNLLNKKVELIIEDGTEHIAKKTCLVLDVTDQFITVHNLKRDVIEYIPISRVVRIEELGGVQR